MKSFFSAFFLTLCCVAVVSAQSPASFRLDPNPVQKVVPLNNDDVEADAVIKDISGIEHTLHWKRTIISNPQNCLVQVCDLNYCYSATTDTASFVLPAGGQGPIIMHLLTPDGVATASAIIHLKFTNVANPADTLTTVWVYTASPSGTGESLAAPGVRLYPNPASEYFALDNAADVQAVRVLTLDGRLMAYYNAVLPAQQFPLTGYPAGTYVVALEDKSGRVFQALEVNKR